MIDKRFHAARLRAHRNHPLSHIALAAASLACSGMAAAQGAPAPAPPAAAEAQAIVVTGSRIRSLDASSISPVSSISALEFEQRGVLRVEDLLNTLPQAFADQSGGGNRGGTVGASGTATINLRNLGNQRTLVLIDGRRLMQGDPARSTAQAPDINNIPPTLIQRVDIVTGGASAVYGSDALAGVVNFILKRNFDGVRVDAQGSVFQHNNDNNIASVATAAGQSAPKGSTWGGAQQGLSVTVGHNFDGARGNVTGFVGYRHINGVGTSERDFSSCNLSATATGYGCTLSSTTYPGQFQLTNPTTGVVRATVALDPTTGNTFRTYRTSDGFNNGNTYDLQAPTKRLNAYLFGQYRLADAAEVYGEFSAMRNEADIRLSPTGVFTVSERIPCSNPFLSAQQQTQLCNSVGLTAAQDANVLVSYRNALGGSRHDFTDHNSARAVAGVRGDLDAWHYDVYAQLGRTGYMSELTNEISLSRFARALTVVPGANGQPVCRSVVDGTDPACVPFNIWQIGAVSPAALAYAGSTVHRTGSLRQAIVSGSVTRDLDWTSPWAVQPVALAAGAEFRDERIEFRPDGNYTSRDTAGNSGGEFPINGSFNVKEAFAELRVPVVENKPWARSLALEAGYRRSSYSTAGSTDAYKLAGEWAPSNEWRLRTGVQRAVRAPYLSELYGPQRVVTAAISDPCEGTAPRATLAQCQASGVTAAQYGNIAPAAGQQSGALVGGNTQLKPEQSDTLTAGIQFTPAVLAGWSFSADYYDIKVDKLIANVPAGITLNQCITGGAFCNLVSRNPATGSLVSGGYVVTTSINSGYLRTKGVDLSISGSVPLASLSGGLLSGRVGINATSTYLASYEVEILPGTQAYRCDGYFGVNCGIPLPKWRHRSTFNWTSGNGLGIAATWRHVGSTANDRTSSATFLTGAYQPYDASLRRRDYLDLALSWEIDKRVTVRAGVNNLTDRDPPLTASTGGGAVANGPFYAGVYDALGRQLFGAVTLKF